MGKNNNLNDELEKLEELESFTDDFADLPPNDIVAYNELRSCADILRMHESGQLDISPDFQRDIVWQNPAQTRFIDSLIKQLPIPSLCISLDYKTEKRLVIDGLQRITSIIKFLSDDEWKLSEIIDIDERIAGKTVHTIKTKTKEIYTRVQNLTIPVTVLRCDYAKKAHNEYLFTIFHRLNTGGAKLNNQEIRNCIYNGPLNTLLKNLASSKKWVKLFDLKKGNIYRFSNEEIILRFFAFHNRLGQYTGKLAKFLNDYMFDNRFPTVEFIAEKQFLFDESIDLIQKNIFDDKPIGNLSKATTEALLIAVATNIKHLQQQTPEQAKILYTEFRQLNEFSIDSLKEGLAAREKVITRINAAINVFSK
ncbi:MAG: DUF262 domain-containing protein [Bacteroidetes bacterium]|nr:DUF262 domain-containing protein [Bacteroidota bacterium]